MDPEGNEQVDRNRDEREEGEHDEHAAAASEGKPKAPEQDEIDSTLWDTDQHSDAPGPTGTG